MTISVNAGSELIREPNLLTPRKKPIGPVEIDWNNTLTNGLKLCIMCDETGNIRDLVSGVRFEPDETGTKRATSTVGAYGKQVSFERLSGDAWNYNATVPEIEITTTDWITVSALLRVEDPGATENYCAVLGLDRPADSGLIFEMPFNASATDDDGGFWMGTAKGPELAGFPIYGEYHMYTVYVYASATIKNGKFYRDGVFVGQDTSWTGGSVNYNYTDITVGSYGGNNVESFNGDIVGIWVWANTKGLEDPLIASFANDPYQILVPK